MTNSLQIIYHLLFRHNKYFYKFVRNTFQLLKIKTNTNRNLLEENPFFSFFSYKMYISLNYNNNKNKSFNELFKQINTKSFQEYCNYMMKQKDIKDG